MSIFDRSVAPDVDSQVGERSARRLSAHEILIALAQGFQLLRGVALFLLRDEMRTRRGGTFAEVLHAVSDLATRAAISVTHDRNGLHTVCGFGSRSR